MSLLPTGTLANQQLYYFLKADGLYLNVSSLVAGNISTATAEISSLTANHISSVSLDSEYLNASTLNTLYIDLDNQILTADATDLLLNGIPIATVSNLSSIGDWSLEPAISTVQMNGNDLNAAGTVSTNNIRGGNALFQNLIAFNALFVSAATSTISSVTTSAELANFSTTNTENLLVADQYLIQGIPGAVTVLQTVSSPTSTTNIYQQAGTNGYNTFWEQNGVFQGGINLSGAGIVLSDNVGGLPDFAVTSNNTVVYGDLLVNGTGNVSSVIGLSSINGFPIGHYEPGGVSTVSTFQTASVSSLTASSINGGPIISGSNWSQYPANSWVNMSNQPIIHAVSLGGDADISLIAASNIHLNSQNGSIHISSTDGTLNMACEDMNVVADEGANITTNAVINMTAKNGYQGEVNITADTGFADIGGVVNIQANGGVTPLGVGWGGEVNITATTGTFTTLSFTSAVNLNAAGINSYAGATAPIGSLAGGNFVHGDALVNITAGVPPIFSDPLCVYIRGTNGILMDSATYMKGPLRPYSDLVQNPTDLYIEDYSNLITHGYVQLRGVSTLGFAGGDTAILGLNKCAFSSIGGEVTGLSSINGLPIGEYTNISSISSLNEWALYPALSSINANGGDILNARSLAVSSFAVPGSYSTTTGFVTLGFTDTGYGGKLNFNTQENGSTFQTLTQEHPPAGGASLILSLVDENLNYTDAALRGLYFGSGLPGSGDQGHVLAGATGLEITSISSVNGLPISAYANISSISSLNEWALYPALSTISFGTGIPAHIQANPGLNIAIEGRNIQLVGDYTNVTGFLLAPAVSTAYIQGTNSNLFGLGLVGLEIDAPNLFLSSPSVVHPGSFNGSTILANSEIVKQAGVSSLTASTTTTLSLTTNFASISTTVTNNATTLALQTSSFLLNSGNYSTILVPQPTINPGVGTSSCLFVNTDLNLGTNDLYAQQVRLGKGQLDNYAEILMYGNDGSTRNILAGTADRTIRVASSTAPTGPGYVLDTALNPPFFSTINQSTACMAYFPSSINNTIGVSTIAWIPPKVVAGNFTSLSTQALTINTPLALWMEQTDYSVGGIATSTNTIVIPTAGAYSFTPSIQFEHPLGAAIADFWIRRNGTDIPNSGSEVYLPAGGQGQTLGVTTFIVQCAAGDKVQVMVASPDTGVTAAFHQSTISPYAKPANPSVVLAVNCLNF